MDICISGETEHEYEHINIEHNHLVIKFINLIKRKNDNTS